jgi:hypothetical protein
MALRRPEKLVFAGTPKQHVKDIASEWVMQSKVVKDSNATAN